MASTSNQLSQLDDFWLQRALYGGHARKAGAVTLSSVSRAVSPGGPIVGDSRPMAATGIEQIWASKSGED